MQIKKKNLCWLSQVKDSLAPLKIISLCFEAKHTHIHKVMLFVWTKYNGSDNDSNGEMGRGEREKGIEPAFVFPAYNKVTRRPASICLHNASHLPPANEFHPSSTLSGILLTELARNLDPFCHLSAKRKSPTFYHSALPEASCYAKVVALLTSCWTHPWSLQVISSIGHSWGAAESPDYPISQSLVLSRPEQGVLCFSLNLSLLLLFLWLIFLHRNYGFHPANNYISCSKHIGSVNPTICHLQTLNNQMLWCHKASALWNPTFLKQTNKWGDFQEDWMSSSPGRDVESYRGWVVSAAGPEQLWSIH